MGDRSLTRRSAPSLGLLAFGVAEAIVGLLTVRGIRIDRRAAGGAWDAAAFRLGVARLGFAIVVFGLVIGHRHSKKTSATIPTYPRGRKVPGRDETRRAARFGHARSSGLTASPAG